MAVDNARMCELIGFAPTNLPAEPIEMSPQLVASVAPQTLVDLRDLRKISDQIKLSHLRYPQTGSVPSYHDASSAKREKTKRAVS